jgi:hypothetical protein
MGSIDAANVLSQLQSLSEERATKVLSLIEDLAELEALEDAEDLKAAREEIAEMERSASAPSAASGKAEFSNTSEANEDPQGTIPYEQLRRECGLDR